MFAAIERVASSSNKQIAEMCQLMTQKQNAFMQNVVLKTISDQNSSTIAILTDQLKYQQKLLEKQMEKLGKKRTKMRKTDENMCEELNGKRSWQKVRPELV